MTTSHETLFIGGGWAPRRLDDPAGWSSSARPAGRACERAAALERLAAELEQRSQEIGRLVSIQNGMPIALSPIIEGLTPVGTLRYMASLLGSAPVEEETSRFLGGDLVIRHEPIGVIAGIVPWNYPQTLSAVQVRPGPGGREHDRAQALPRDGARLLRLRGGGDRGRPRPAWSTSCPAAARSAPTWSSTRTSTRSRSPAPPPPGGRSPRSAVGCFARSRSSLAASRPRSSSTTPTSTWPRSARTCSPPPWSTTARPATRAPASSPRGRATTRSWTRSPPSPRRCR